MKKRIFSLPFFGILAACQSTGIPLENSFPPYKRCAERGYKVGTLDFDRCLREEEILEIKRDREQATLSRAEVERLKAKEQEIDINPREYKQRTIDFRP